MGATNIKVTVVREKDGGSKETSEKRADLPRSGSVYTDEQVKEMGEEVIDSFECKDSIDDMFVLAFVAGMTFGVVQEGEQTYGMTAVEYAHNSYGWCLQGVAIDKLIRELSNSLGK